MRWITDEKTILGCEEYLRVLKLKCSGLATFCFSVENVREDFLALVQKCRAESGLRGFSAKMAPDQRSCMSVGYLLSDSAVTNRSSVLARRKHLVCLVSDHHRTTYAPAGATVYLSVAPLTTTGATVNSLWVWATPRQWCTRLNK